MIKKTTAYTAVCDVCGGPLLCGDLFKTKDKCERAIYAAGALYPTLGGRTHAAQHATQHSQTK